MSDDNLLPLPEEAIGESKDEDSCKAGGVDEYEMNNLNSMFQEII